MERGRKVTADVNSDHGSEKDGQYFEENKSCPSCKEEIERLKQENKRLKEELAEVSETVSRGCHCGHKCESQAPSSMDAADGFPEEGSRGLNEATGAMKGSSVMRKTRNDSSQMAGVFRQSPDRMGSERMDCDETHSRAASKTASKPSTSVTASAPKREGAHLRGAAGGRDDGAVGENSLSELKKVPRKLMGRLEFSDSHTVLVDVYYLSVNGTIVAINGLTLWDANSVRMPYAEKNMLQGESRWKKIRTSLRNLEKCWSVTAKDVEKTIKLYNPKYKEEWSFDALQKFFEVMKGDEGKSLTPTLRRMAGLALELPEVCPKGIPLLRTGKSHSITLSQKQIACLLANAFFCTFPHRNATNSQAEYAKYPTINFHSLFGRWSERKMQKFRAIFHYFRVVTGAEKKEWKVPEGLVTFSREYISESSLLSWKSCSEHLTNLHIFSEGTIEGNGQDKLQVDFACSLVGGGVLASGLVQEEILFLVHPELIVARLFTEKLGDTECLRITGAQQYSEYYGYKDEFTWVKHHEDKTERDEWLRRKRQIVAIDALDFKNPKDQFHMKKVDRELNKAYCGFTGDSETHCYYPTIATGNWGCGAFGGDVRLKALIQMMAAAVAKRDMAYFTFGDRGLKQELEEMHRFLTQRNITVGSCG
ncbi:poly(ADP-ribose) glycohydrolase-like isoform X2 [Conger conger]|uniref:poly(ADP-ribose) glycohydrolase-like isoform X2 n=1 Tax=Conger conger TaxID=82655 RepID=UPI002A59B23F|nr:poly(ADP-ribose) glycohydrolase-like isoform X2 [Conger conger]